MPYGGNICQNELRSFAVVESSGKESTNTLNEVSLNKNADKTKPYDD